MTELFSRKQWIGEFFLPDAYERRFSGQIEYSPENGVLLSYTIKGHAVPTESDVIFGVLATGEKCTLGGRFSPQHAGITLKNGLTTRSGKAGFMFLVIGDFLTHDELLFDFNFSLTNLQEFFFYKGHKDIVKYSEKPLFTLSTPFGDMTVGNNASFRPLHKDIKSQIYSRDPDALNELESAFKEIEAKYPNSFFMLKKDIAYRIRFQFNSGTTIRQAFDHISDIANLFALLIYSPVYPDSIHAQKKQGVDHTITLEIYPSMVLDTRTIELATQERFHFRMPITYSSIALDQIVRTWLQAPRNHSTIISSIQHETGFRDEHSVHGEIVLYATQFESISHNAGEKGKYRKYEYPLNSYGCQKLRDGLSTTFGKVGLTDIGKAVGNMRNEIAHVGKPRTLLATLSLKDMVHISQYLELTIVGYIMATIGVPTSVITKYQEDFCPDD